MDIYRHREELNSDSENEETVAYFFGPPHNVYSTQDRCASLSTVVT